MWRYAATISIGVCIGTATASARPAHEVFRIVRPAVDRAYSVLPNVTFEPGDTVLVRAGGCVNVSGNTPMWRHYVRPTGDDSDRLFHGRISIPGATAGLVRIATVKGKPLRVAVLPQHWTPPLRAAVGYEDDYFVDNGYEGDASLRPGVCKDDAWIEIERTAGVVAVNAVGSPQPEAPLDLYWNTVDENFLPLNPRWFFEKSTGQLPNSRLMCNDFREGPQDSTPWTESRQCTTWSTDVDEANIAHFWCHLIFSRMFSRTIHGHANWAVVTYDNARVFFEGKSHLDGDLDFGIDTGRRGVAQGNETRPLTDTKVIHGEFSSREVVDRMHGDTWWERFQAASDVSTEAANNLLDGRPVKVIGLLGFDNEHMDDNGTYAELHPIYVFAIRTEQTAQLERWAIFVRNWGNQGGCSHGSFWGHWSHPLFLPSNELTVFFDGVGELSDARTTLRSRFNRHETIETFSNGHSTHVSAKSAGSGVIVTFELGDRTRADADEALTWGELVFRRVVQ